jgi:cytochrome c oxidase subunit II
MNEFLRRLLMLPEQSSTIARELDTLHYFVITVTMLGAAAVTAAVLYFIVKYREGAGRGEDEPPDPRPDRARGGMPLRLELGVAGGLLALFVLWWVIGFRQFVGMQTPPQDSLTIYTTAKQWMWGFAYPNGAGSSGVLYVPVGQPVKLVMTSRDVIHSFYVPAFRVKQDVLPGRSTSVWFEVEEPGRFQIMCTEYCGMGHSTMRGEVVALAAADYDRQLARLSPLAVAGARDPEPAVVGDAVPAQPLSLAEMGERVAAEQGCLRCHTVDGTPHIGPTWAGLFASSIPLRGGGRAIADEAYLTESMMDPLARIHLGFVPVMPSYRGQLGAAQVGALVEFIRALGARPRERGGDPLPRPVEGEVPLVQPLPGTGQPVQPAEGAR